MKQHAPLFLELATKAKQKVKEIDIHKAKEYLMEGKAIFIDVREESEWQQGYIPNAIHLSKGVIERDIEKKIPDQNTALILYCSGGFRSALATKSLLEMGYTNVSSIEGGVTAWINAGYPLVLHEDK